MLISVPTTIPAENRDFPEWHRGRETYLVWVLRMEAEAVQEKFTAARKHLNGYLLEPYHRQPHITLFVCGFLVDSHKYNDDFTHAQLQEQIQVLKSADIAPFEIQIGGLNSFASAPFLEVHDPSGGITRLREVFSRGAREFRTAPYTPHLTVGLYAGVFPSQDVAGQMAGFSCESVRWTVEQVTLATYRADEYAGKLSYKQDFVLGNAPGML